MSTTDSIMWFRNILLLVAISSATIGAEAPAAMETNWNVRARVDDFTEESYFIVSPNIESADEAIAKTKAEPPITNEERIAAMGKIFGTDDEGRHRTAETMKRRPAEYDNIVELNREHARMERAGKHNTSVVQDLSYFLRPFIAIDNGVLIVGATVDGSVDIFGDLKIQSMAPAGIVQLKIDQNTALDIDSAKNPPNHLPGEMDPKDAAAAAAQIPPEFGKLAADSMSRQSPYAAISGEAADLVLDQLLAGKIVKVRRKPDPLWGGTSDSYSAVKTFTLGAKFKEAFDQIGLRRNMETGKWELDPSKADARKALLKATPNKSK